MDQYLGLDKSTDIELYEEIVICANPEAKAEICASTVMDAWMDSDKLKARSPCVANTNFAL